MNMNNMPKGSKKDHNKVDKIFRYDENMIGFPKSYKSRLKIHVLETSP